MTKNQADVSQIFLVYMATIGDVERTALALDIEPSFVLKLAKDEGWADKISRISLLSKSGKQGDWERGQNRALNYVQAHILRRMVDAQLVLLSDKKPEEVMLIVDKDGNEKYSAKIFLDLAATMQKVHEMTYSALGDSVKERTDKGPQGADATEDAMHASVIAALNKTGLPTDTVPNTLADSANEAVEALKLKLGTSIPVESTVDTE